MILLENDHLKATIAPYGAELHELFNKETGLQYLWTADPAFWPRHSPVLFPIVGGLKEDAFIYKGNSYKMSKHGFARDMQFEMEEQTTDKVILLLKSDEETLKKYPFHFELRLIYQLRGNSIFISYEVKNPTVGPLFFSLGAHPAFNIPLHEGTEYEDYYLEFEQEESSLRWTLDANLVSSPVPYLHNQKMLRLRQDLFYDDALIFKDLKSSCVTIRNDKSNNGIRCHINDFPYLGVWAAKDAPFVCIEPWAGIADSVNHDQILEHKEGIVELPPLQKWQKNWAIEVF